MRITAPGISAAHGDDLQAPRAHFIQAENRTAAAAIVAAGPIGGESRAR